MARLSRLAELRALPPDLHSAFIATAALSSPTKFHRRLSLSTYTTNEAEHEIADTDGGLGATEDEEAEFDVAYCEDGSVAAYDEEAMHQIAHEDSDSAEAIALGSDGIQDSEERPSTARDIIEEASSLLGERPGKTEQIDEDEDNDDAPYPRTVQE
jgi:hypothetical protein